MLIKNGVLIVSLSFGVVKQSTKISVQSQVEQDRVKASARLYSSKGLKAITNHQAAIRDELLTMAIQVPSGLRGAYLMSSAMAQDIRDFLDASRVKRDGLIDNFIASDYQLEKDRARIALGASYKERDFPSIDDVKTHFSMNYSFFSMEVPSGLPSDLLEAEKAKFKANLETVFTECRDVLRGTMAELVEKLATSLTPDANGKRRRLYQSGVDNLTAFLDTVNARDITSDAAIKDLSEKAKRIIGTYNADDLRGSAVGQNVRDNLNKVKTEIDNLIRRDGGRRIDLDMD